jgi:alpha-beta hydrolase superfamily lysophospholipase
LLYLAVAAATNRAVRQYVIRSLFLPLSHTQPLIDMVVSRALNNHTGATLVVTGHSLGGALASLAAFDLKQSSGTARTFFLVFVLVIRTCLVT